MTYSRKGISRHSPELSLILLAVIGTIYKMAVKRCRNTHYWLGVRKHIKYISVNIKSDIESIVNEGIYVDLTMHRRL